MTEGERPTERLYRQALEAVESDLVHVVRHHTRLLGPNIVAHALIEVAGSVCADIVSERPDAASDINQKLDQLQLYLLATNGVAQ